MPQIKHIREKIHIKTNMKEKNLSKLATVMIKTSISQLMHKINENKIKGFHIRMTVHKESKKMHVSTFIILDMFGSLVYLLSMTNRPKK